MGKTKVIEKASIENKLDKLIDIVSDVAQRVNALEQTEPEVKETKSYIPTTHVPERYLQVVQQILGPKFGIEKELSEKEYGIHANNDPNLYHIIVPDEYSTLTESEKEMHLKDIRSIAVQGDDDLQTYCELVRTQIIKYHQNEGKPLPLRGFE